MKQVIDNLTTLSGWTSSSGASITLTDWKEFSASNLDKQFLVTMNQNSFIEKVFFPTIALKYKQIRFNAIAKIDKYKNTINSVNDIHLRILFFDGFIFEEFVVPITKNFEPITFKLKNINNLSKIKIVANKYIQFFISEIICYEDKGLFDLVYEIKNEIESLNEYNKDSSIGFATCQAGSKEIIVSNPKHLEKYLCVKIGNEIHQVNNILGNKITFLQTFNGETILNNYSNQEIFVHIPVYFNPVDIESSIPGISILNNCTIERVGYENSSFELDSISPDIESARFVKTGNTFKYDIIVEGVWRKNFTSQIVINLLKKFINLKSIIWVNGNKCEITDKQINVIDFSNESFFYSKANLNLEIIYTEETFESEIIENQNLEINLLTESII
jgi:hypothetical protein